MASQPRGEALAPSRTGDCGSLSPQQAWVLGMLGDMKTGTLSESHQFLQLAVAWLPCGVVLPLRTPQTNLQCIKAEAGEEGVVEGEESQSP